MPGLSRSSSMGDLGAKNTPNGHSGKEEGGTESRPAQGQAGKTVPSWKPLA